MFEKLLQLLAITCRHSHTSKPFAAQIQSSSSNADWERVEAGGVTHYVVCFDCGKKFAYDWKNMRVDKDHPLTTQAS